MAPQPSQGRLSQNGAYKRWEKAISCAMNAATCGDYSGGHAGFDLQPLRLRQSSLLPMVTTYVHARKNIRAEQWGLLTGCNARRGSLAARIFI